nr:hypothetical protein [Tanacetum cinerariifolium]
MLNKDNYVPWSSRLLRYANSKPKGKFLVNSINNSPYVRRMIHEPGDPNSVPPVVKSTHEKTYDELTKKEVKQMEANDQSIQTILMGLLKDINEKKAKLFNEWERFNSTKGKSTESYYHRISKLMNDFSKNKHFLEKIASNLKNQVVHNVVQNRGIQNVGNQNGLIVVPWIANPNVNQNRNGNVVAAHTEGNRNKNNGNQIRCYNYRGLGHYDINEIEEVKANCILMVNLQQASTFDTQTDKAPVYDLNKSVEIERLQAQLGDLKGKSMDTQCASNTLDPSSQKLKDENVSL